MISFIYKCFGITPRDGEKITGKDDFSEFFYDTKSAKKTKIIREIMCEATEEQKAVIRRYKEKNHVFRKVS